MVAVRLPRWRLQHRLSLSALVIGAGQLLICLLLWMPFGAWIGLALVLFGGWNQRRLHQRRERWLAFNRKLAHHGAQIVYTFENGLLLQRSNKTAEVLGIPRGQVIESPRGWFLTYELAYLGETPADEAISTDKASMWIPHTAVRPTQTRTVFAEQLETLFEVRRL